MRGSRRPTPVVQRKIRTLGVAALDHLGVAGDDLDAGDPRGGGDRVDLRAQGAGVEPLLQDHRERRRERPRAAHGEVVDGAVDGEGPSDRAAGEAQRRDDEGVRRHREVIADRAGVGDRRAGLGSRGGDEQALDQGLRRVPRDRRRGPS